MNGCKRPGERVLPESADGRAQLTRQPGLLLLLTYLRLRSNVPIVPFDSGAAWG
jgi:hypothetical protein